MTADASLFKLDLVASDPSALAFANPEMPAFAIDEIANVEIWGVVTWTLHKPQRR